MYVIETCLLDKLPGIFTPEMVLKLDNDTVSRIAGESSESMQERANLGKKLAALKDTQKDLHLLDRHKPSGMSIFSKPMEISGNQGPSSPLLEPVALRPSTPPAESIDAAQTPANPEESEDSDSSDDISDVSSDESNPEMPLDSAIYGAIERLDKAYQTRDEFLPGVAHCLGHFIKNLKLVLECLEVLPPVTYLQMRGNVGGTKSFLLGLSRLVPDGVLTVTTWNEIFAEVPANLSHDLETWDLWARRVVDFTEDVCDVLESTPYFTASSTTKKAKTQRVLKGGESFPIDH